MNRFFIEVAYLGTQYAGFQVQQNAVTVQSEVEKALAVYFRRQIPLTGSSRTDAGVHARQNFFHFDFERDIPTRSIYNLNALLPSAIVVRSIRRMHEGAHCRFDATAREYKYFLYNEKNPFIEPTAFFYPYTLNRADMQEAASVLMRYTDFRSFSKRNTQVKTFQCRIQVSEWVQEGDCWVYHVIANRFLRGMVRGLVGTMLQVGRGKMTVKEFEEVIRAGDNRNADFAVPGQGLSLMRVMYPEGYWERE